MRICAWCKADRYRSLSIAAVLLFILGAVLLTADYWSSKGMIEEGLERNSYGQGSRIEDLEVSVENGTETEVQIEVSERAYKEAEVQALFSRCEKKLEKLMIGSNKSLDRIEADMNLVTEIPGEPVEITWELSRYDVMNIYGELQEEKLTEEGTLLTLAATLSYTQNQEKRALYECSAMLYPKSQGLAERQAREIQAAVREADEKTRTEKILPLPENVSGKDVKYYYPMEDRGAILMAMAVVIGILLYALEKQNAGKEMQKRELQMRLDYPEAIHKFTLFLGAGMTVKRAWKKMVSDYEKQKDIWGERYVYEEMRVTCHEMESGIIESESYERFGRRCGLQEYVRFGTLLSQNLRRGAKGLNQILKAEAVQAFEERKARAKRLGEEAGTKLLGPMFLMLAVVLFIVIVPAFMSVKI